VDDEGQEGLDGLPLLGHGVVGRLVVRAGSGWDGKGVVGHGEHGVEAEGERAEDGGHGAGREGGLSLVEQVDDVLRV